LVDSSNLRVVKEFWNAFESEGLLASMELMLAHAHEDVELRPFVGEGRTFRGVDEVREFMRQEVADGASLRGTPWNFEEDGDAVVVTGSLRLQRRDGSIADSQLRWTYRFRDGRLVEASSGPLAA
jgi:ketosteroid isomerase-like protein